MKIIGVTQRNLCDNFYQRIEEISKYDLEYLILREKDLNDEELETMANKIKSILVNSNIKLIINGNINVAIKTKAYGVHLSFKDFCGEFQRYFYKDQREGVGQVFSGVKGVSVHNIKEAIEAEEQGANYLIYGHIFETSCKKGLAPKGVRELQKICGKIKIPVYAIGGINSDNFIKITDAGAYGISIMSSLMRGVNIDRLLGI